jgi:DNA-binding Lrp family transcriptional regulator
MQPTRLKTNLGQQSSGTDSVKDPVRACVLIRVRHGRHFQVARKIATIPGVRSAFAVVGAADVVVSVEVPDMRALMSVGTRIGDLEDVSTTETFVAAEV